MVNYNSSIYESLPVNAKSLIITDSNVAGLYLWELHRTLVERKCTVYEIILPAGEGTKNLENVERIYEMLAEGAFCRTDYVIALGGGVITDISGFCAATFLRGMKYISIPTTLLSQVDAAHGGKCGVDLEWGKNLVGTFYEPEQIICDINFFETLPKEELIQGMAEVIKYAFIMDEALYEQLSANNSVDGLLTDKEALNIIVQKCIADKNRIVSSDYHDHEIRRILNFGHTFGHALECISGYKVNHGSAVSVGMVMMTEKAVEKGFCEKTVLDSLIKMLSDYGLPTKCSQLEVICDLSEEELITSIDEVISRDKKRDSEVLQVVILNSIGHAKCISYGELL